MIGLGSDKNVEHLEKESTGKGEVQLRPEKEEAPEDVKTKKETGKYNLWGFFLLHLSR